MRSTVGGSMVPRSCRTKTLRFMVEMACAWAMSSSALRFARAKWRADSEGLHTMITLWHAAPVALGDISGSVAVAAAALVVVLTIVVVFVMVLRSNGAARNTASGLGYDGQQIPLGQGRTAPEAGMGAGGWAGPAGAPGQGQQGGWTPPPNFNVAGGNARGEAGGWGGGQLGGGAPNAQGQWGAAASAQDGDSWGAPAAQ